MKIPHVLSILVALFMLYAAAGCDKGPGAVETPGPTMTFTETGTITPVYSPTVTSTLTVTRTFTGTPTTTPTPDGYNSVTTSGITFKWKVNGANLDCKMSAPTTGWVAIGLNSAGQMNGANIVIGYVTGGTTAVIDDQKGGFHVHNPDTIDNVANVSGTESGGVTELVFTIPMADDANSQDLALVQGNTYWLITTNGSNGDDSFGSFMPPNRGILQFQLQ